MMESPPGTREPIDLSIDLQPESPDPLYQQVRSILASWIRNGQISPHDKLPSERQLCECFGVSRMTIRQALSKLKEDDLIYTRPGKGMFVAEPDPQLELTFVLTGFSEEVGPARTTLTSQVLNAQLITASPKVAKELDLTPGEELVHIERLRLVNGSPIAYQSVYVPHRLCPGFLKHDYHRKSTLKILQEEFDLHLLEARQIIKAGMSRPQAARHLGLARPEPVLILERRTNLRNGPLVEMSTGDYLADSFQLVLTLDMSNWELRTSDESRQISMQTVSSLS